MIEKIDNNQFQNIPKAPSSKQLDSSRVSQNNQADASLLIHDSSLIEKANQLNQEDPSAVQRARELLSSGQLESAENIRQAAENIIKFGI